jgi:[ribosomal protein S18]-alanine N-acetyltransferase
LSVAIEDMTEADVPAALAIDLASFPASQMNVGGGDVRSVREAQLTEELARAWAHLRVARGDGGVLLGYALFWHVADEVHLLNVAVAPAVRRQGVGRALMDDLLAYVAAHAATKVLLEVRAGNGAAIALYEALGFTRLGVRTRYYADGEDALEMMLETG